MSEVDSTFRSRILRSGGAIGASTLFQYGMAVGSQIFLARLLSPEDFGGFALVLIIQGVLANLRNLQGADFLVAHKGDDFEVAYRSVFTMDLLLSGLVWIMALLYAESIMTFAGRPELTSQFRWMTPTIILMAFSIPLVQFQRDIDFVRASLPGVIGMIFGPLLKVGLALSGFGIWSLIYGEMGRQLLVAILIWVTCRSRPGLGLDPATMRRALVFGFPTMLSGLMVYYYWKLDDYFVSLFLGTAPLGFYFLAFRIPEYLFNLRMALSPLVYSSLCSLSTGDERREGYRILIRMTASLTALPVIVSLLHGERILTTVFGMKWAPAVLPFQLLMVATAIRMTFGYLSDIIKSEGRTWWLPIMTLQNAFVLTIGAYYLTQSHGIAGTAGSVLITVLAGLPLTVYVSRRLVGVHPIQVAAGTLPPIVATILLGTGMQRLLPSTLPLDVLQITGITVLYVGLVRRLDPEVSNQVRDILRIP